MSIPVLIQCADEIRRLSVAGSALAVGDFRLKRLIPPLEKYGRRVAVFGKIAHAIQNLTEENESASSENLLRLATLVNAVLYTGGETGIEGEWTDLDTSDMGVTTPPTSAQALRPLLKALTTTGSGRYEIITDAHERGLFRDLRLIRPAIRALDDRYKTIADYVAEKVLPIYGRAILPLIREGLDFKGGRGHARRLEVIGRICGQDAWDLYLDALKDGSKEIRIAAIRCLASLNRKSDEVLAVLMAQTKARSKALRRAALNALGERDDDAVADVLIRALEEGDMEIISASVRSNANPRLLAYLISTAEKLFTSLTDEKPGENPEADKAASRLLSLLTCLETRRDEKTEAFLLSCFANSDRIHGIRTKGPVLGEEVSLKVAELLLDMGTPRAIEALVGGHERLADDLFPYAFLAAVKGKDPAFVYDRFSPYLLGAPETNSSETRAKAIISAIENFFEFGYPAPRHLARLSPEAEAIRKEPRWLDAAIKAGATSLVCRLIGPGDENAAEFLVHQYHERISDGDVYEIVLGLIRAGHPDAPRLLMQAIQATLTGPHAYERYYLMWLIRLLPPAALPETEALAQTLPEELAGDIREHLRALGAEAV